MHAPLVEGPVHSERTKCKLAKLPYLISVSMKVQVHLQDHAVLSSPVRSIVRPEPCARTAVRDPVLNLRPLRGCTLADKGLHGRIFAKLRVLRQALRDRAAWALNASTAAAAEAVLTARVLMADASMVANRTTERTNFVDFDTTID